jgi:hypothetical protein
MLRECPSKSSSTSRDMKTVITFPCHSMVKGIPSNICIVVGRRTMLGQWLANRTPAPLSEPPATKTTPPFHKARRIDATAAVSAARFPPSTSRTVLSPTSASCANCSCDHSRSARPARIWAGVIAKLFIFVARYHYIRHMIATKNTCVNHRKALAVQVRPYRLPQSPSAIFPELLRQKSVRAI